MQQCFFLFPVILLQCGQNLIRMKIKSKKSRELLNTSKPKDLKSILVDYQRPRLKQVRIYTHVIYWPFNPPHNPPPSIPPPSAWEPSSAHPFRSCTFSSSQHIQFPEGKHCGTLKCHLLQDLKVPGTNLLYRIY